MILLDELVEIAGERFEYDEHVLLTEMSCGERIQQENATSEKSQYHAHK
jgi:hypothetical protein